MSKTNTGAFWGGILLGTAFGSVIGLLVAPRSGRETRQILKKSADALPQIAEDLSSTIQLQADHLSESALQNWDETLARLKEAVSAGIEASKLETKVSHNSHDINPPPSSSLGTDKN